MLRSYPAEPFAGLYHLRWAQEEHYKCFKCRVEVENWSGKSALTICQDFHARLILGFGVLAAEPRGATIGPMSDGRSCLPSKALGCCDGGPRPSAGTDHDLPADDQSDLLDR